MAERTDAEHAHRIRTLVTELNTAMHDAVEDGLSVGITTINHQQLGRPDRLVVIAEIRKEL